MSFFDNNSIAGFNNKNKLMIYSVRSSFFAKNYYKECIWAFSKLEKKIYLSFDDGPHPVATLFVLDELKKFNAKASFFCIGKNVVEHNSVFERIKLEGHSVGNHTFNHLKGWKTSTADYIENVKKASGVINSNLFRPPYGKIKKLQIRELFKTLPGIKIMMWSVLSGDFDSGISPEKCLKNVLKNAKNGSIIVFHDSEKAFERLKYALPLVLQYFTERGFTFEKIPQGGINK